MSEFDIRDYDFDSLYSVSVDADGDINFQCGLYVMFLTRSDTIALAKHFKITQDEIEGFGT